MKIAILLPYKENFSVNYAGAVSLFVKDIVKNSKHFKSTYVFGNMDFTKPFLKNYINLLLKKKFFRSSSKIYVEEFLKAEKSLNSDNLFFRIMYCIGQGFQCKLENVLYLYLKSIFYYINF